MSDTLDLYQELILDHYKRPRNRGKMESADCEAEGYNPLCGDRVAIYVKLDGDTITDVHFDGTGCAISTASASLLTESMKGKTVQEVRSQFERFQRLVTGQATEAESADGMGKLEAFATVSQYPARVKCAVLAWHTLKAALDKQHDVVTTE